MKREEDAIRSTILALLSRRSGGSTICPSEVPRKLFPEDWRSRMDLTRKVAVKMREEGIIEICQKGEVVPPGREFRGPIRLRLKE